MLELSKGVLLDIAHICRGIPRVGYLTKPKKKLRITGKLQENYH